MGIDDYIKRSDCIEAITKAEKWWWNADDLRNYREIFERIPAADVEPKKTGKWIAENDRYFHWHCSECGYVIGVMKMDAEYCPKCGAHMDKGEGSAEVR